jgi:UDP-N-acetylmuramoyl-tripeptide--D-alanyl-D-alanine ligase
VTKLTAGWVAASAGGALTGDGDREFGSVSIDTRTIAPGALFVAIKGERFDGAEFAVDAIARGAAGVIVPRGWSASSAKASAERNAVVIEVDDTTAALQAIARAVRRESGTRVVAITGSAGKTTTKELTSDLLAARYRVVRNRGNLNNHIGLPLSLMELRESPEIAVVELGMNHAGEIRTLVRIAEPDVRVWTNVGEAHLGFFASVDAIADAKAEILEAASRNALLIGNADDDRVMSRMPAFAGRTRTFGIERNADVRATNVADRGIDGTAAHVTTAKGEIDVALPLVGRGNLSNALAAIAVAIEFDIPLATIAERLARATPASHRGEIVRLASGITVIDDSYNANPTATKRAIEVLASTQAARRIAVLGEMLELGEQSAALHESVGRAVADRRIDALFAVGGDSAAAIVSGALAAGMARGAVRLLPTSDEAAGVVSAEARRGDLILVKGSRGVKTDRVVERLRTDRG